MSQHTFRPRSGPACGRIDRRTLLADTGLGFAGLALGALLFQDGVARADAAQPWAPPTGRPEFRPRAKSVIWIFLSGGYSHLETFDPKPALNQYAGQTFDKTPFPDPLKSPLHDKRSRSVVASEINVRDRYPSVYPLQIGYRKHGQSGIEVSDWLPETAKWVDHLAIVRSMYTTDNDHAAENQIHTGRHRLDELQPSVGAWVHYGLGSLNDNLPQFVVVGGPTRADTRVSIDAGYLGPEHAGVPLALDPTNPLPYGRRGADVLEEEQRNEYDLIGRLNRLSGGDSPADARLRARIRSYELAFRMQTAVPEALAMGTESDGTRRMYGIDQAHTRQAGERLLAARRLVERGVRFVQVYPTPYGVWDSHQKLKDNHGKQCAAVDRPVAGLLADLQQRGLWEDTVVVFCTEFGRTPGLELRGGGKDGRDHHPHGFSVWLAGAGLKRGFVHGATDELGFHALEPAHYVTDLHSTVLHLLGMDFRHLEIPGR
ncbi:MAG: DUF1501 domain-containing protein, partial [Armatimonadetes bacterium]|nr:DUF1501 domain-containing protein [Armatimonadota bacterium]